MNRSRPPILLLIIFGSIVLIGMAAVAMFLLAGDQLDAFNPLAPPACDPGEQSAENADTSGFQVHLIEHGDHERCYLLYIPESYDVNTPTPIVMNLGGFAMRAHVAAEVTQWHKLAETEQFIVIYAEGFSRPTRWNSAPHYDENGIDDVGFLLKVLETTIEQLNIDSSKVYLSGFSNGGGMAYRMACEATDTFAAIGTVSGIYFELESPCRPITSIPVFAFHGTADQTVLYDGTLDSGGHRLNIYPSMLAWGASWAERNGCEGTAEIESISADVSATFYVNCDDNASVRLYTIDGGHHGWPNTESSDGPRIQTDVNATELLWTEFSQHSR